VSECSWLDVAVVFSSVWQISRNLSARLQRPNKSTDTSTWFFPRRVGMVGIRFGWIHPMMDLTNSSFQNALSPSFQALRRVCGQKPAVIRSICVCIARILHFLRVGSIDTLFGGCCTQMERKSEQHLRPFSLLLMRKIPAATCILREVSTTSSTSLNSLLEKMLPICLIGRTRGLFVMGKLRQSICIHRLSLCRMVRRFEME